MKKNTIEEFKKLIEKTIEKYAHQKRDFGFNYTTNEESYQNLEYFLITNTQKATKIIYDRDIQFILKREIYINDLKTVTEMLERL